MIWSVSKAKAKLSEVLHRSRKSPQIIESHGEPLAVIISKNEFDRLINLSHEPKISAMEQWLTWVDHFKMKNDLEFEIPKRTIEPNREILFSDEGEE